MALEFFTDLIDALGKVTKGLKAIVNFPKKEREKIHQTFDETYRLIDTTMNMVIIRLGDILLLESDDDMLRETAGLDNFDDWLRAEREFRLCQSLRAALRETEGLTGKLAGAVSTKDWDALLGMMQGVLLTEGEVAQFISSQFHQLASDAVSARSDATKTNAIRTSLTTLRTALIAERQKLIKGELELYQLV